MPTFQYACPQCRSRLTTDRAVPVGKRIKCPSCGTAFEVDVEVEGEEGPEAPNAFTERTDRRPPKSRSRPEAAEMDQATDKRGSRQKKISRRGSNILTWMGVALAVAGLLVFIVLAVYLWRTSVPQVPNEIEVNPISPVPR